MTNKHKTVDSREIFGDIFTITVRRKRPYRLAYITDFDIGGPHEICKTPHGWQVSQPIEEADGECHGDYEDHYFETLREAKAWAIEHGAEVYQERYYTE